MRTIEVSGDLTLAALSTTAITGSLAAATYMCGVWAGAKIGCLHAATTLSGKTAAGLAATAGVAGTVALGAATAIAGAGSIAWWVNTIFASRDVWDNSFARDACFFHKMRDHHVLPSDDHHISCHHQSGEWASTNSRVVVGHRGIRWN